MKTVAAILLIAGAAWAQEPTPRERVAAAAAGLGEVLKQLLSEELKRGGFEGAAKSCSESAQTVTEEFAKEKGMEIRRVSLKYRNRKDQPDEWESVRLREWAASGGPPKEVFETVTENGRQYLRYLKPITIQAMCLSCHGASDQIPAEVSVLLNERYPRDKATGYKVGELRGAYSATLAIGESIR
jgi:Protein of unknown function (DUF3365)